MEAITNDQVLAHFLQHCVLKAPLILAPGNSGHGVFHQKGSVLSMHLVFSSLPETNLTPKGGCRVERAMIGLSDSNNQQVWPSDLQTDFTLIKETFQV